MCTERGTCACVCLEQHDAPCRKGAIRGQDRSVALCGCRWLRPVKRPVRAPLQGLGEGRWLLMVSGLCGGR